MWFSSTSETGSPSRSRYSTSHSLATAEHFLGFPGPLPPFLTFPQKTPITTRLERVVVSVWNVCALSFVLTLCLLIWFSRLYNSWACVRSISEVLLLCQFTNLVGLTWHGLATNGSHCVPFLLTRFSVGSVLMHRDVALRVWRTVSCTQTILSTVSPQSSLWAPLR